MMGNKEFFSGNSSITPNNEGEETKVDYEYADDELSPENGYDDEAGQNPISSNDGNQNKEETDDEQKDDDRSSEHDGKYFVIQKGKAKCNQGMSFPNFKVTSHQKHYWNDEKGEADYLAVTEEDLQFNPAAQPFGSQCKLQPSGSSYLPCSYAPAGKWQKCYDKVKVMDKSCVTEMSELQCAIGGKITVMKHGQQSEIGKSNVKKSSPQEQHVYNPVVDFIDFKEEVDDTAEAW